MSNYQLRTTPPKVGKYLTWCEDCEEAVSHEEGSCAACASLDLKYFILESDVERIVAELKSELQRERRKVEKLEAAHRKNADFDLEEKVSTKALRSFRVLQEVWAIDNEGE